MATSSVFAATYVVPTDRESIRRADAIVLASALSSYPQEADNGSIETVTVISIEEVLKGTIATDTLELHEPGGRLGKKVRVIFGAPTFKEGERLLLFLKEFAPGKWASSDFALGKFSFETDDAGQKLLMRQESDIAGWDADLKEHHEGRRSAEKFLDFVRTEAKGGMGKIDYAVAKHGLSVRTTAERLASQTNAASTSPKSYTADDPTNGWRWTTFPSAVTYRSFNTSVNPTAAVNAINAAFASWNNDTLSNVNLFNGGAEPGAANGLTGGVPAGAADGRNSIRFEIDLSAYGTFTCGGGGYSGLLGVGGISNAPGTHVGPAGETFNTISEGDVDMNLNVLGCALLINSGDLNSAVTHEVGHSIGFRHADQNRAGTAACVSSATNECSTFAIMKAFIPNNISAALQTWDINAVRAVYPNAAVAPPGAPSIGAIATSSTSVSVTWSAVATADSYDVFRRQAGVPGFALLANTLTPGFNDTTATSAQAYLYKVQAKNAGGSSPDSNSDLATTVIFTNDPLGAGIIVQVAHLNQLRSAVNAIERLAGSGVTTFTDSGVSGLRIKSLHVTQLRTSLDSALGALVIPTSVYTNSANAGTIVRASDFQEIRNRMK